MVFGKEIVEQGRAYAANVERACGAGREADAYFRGHHDDMFLINS